MAGHIAPFRGRPRWSTESQLMVEAIGDAMKPTIKDGDVLVIDKSDSRIRGGGVYAICYGGELVVRRVELTRDGGALIRCDNPIYEPEFVPPNEVESLQIVGRVIWSGGFI